jgi:plastocyanin
MEMQRTRHSGLGPIAALAAGLCLAALAAGPAHAHGPTVTIGHNRVEPAQVTVPVGGIVHFQNVDEMPGGHTVVADDGSFESPPLAKGGSWHQIFTAPGEHRFHIGEHPGAKGVVIVVDAAGG